MRRPDPDLQRRRNEEIVAAATACFLEKGFHKTSVQDIAERAGLSMGLLYRYFPSKESIIEAAAKAAGREARAHIECFAKATDVVAGFGELARELLQTAAVPGYQALLAEIHAESFRSAALRRLEQADVASVQEALAGALSRHQQAGRLAAAVDVSALAVVLLAALEGLATTTDLLAGSSPEPMPERMMPERMMPKRMIERSVQTLARLLTAALPPKRRPKT